MFGKVTIAMATYNGAKYLEEQLDSIISQTFRGWKLIIRDDNSNDGTKKILEDYSKIDDRITCIFGDENLGPAMNFNELLKHSLDSDYLLFSDQDDVWLEDKIEISLNEIRKGEELKGNLSPILLYSDLRYVDNYLTDIQVKRCNPKNKSIMTLLGFNYMWGCTMVLNKSLVNIAYPISHKAQNHDYWVALHAQISGTIIHMETQTILYRQHSSNVTGGSNNFSLVAKMKSMRKIFRSYESQLEQNLSVLSSYEMNQDFIDYISIFNSRGILSIMRGIKFKLHKNSALETIFYYIFIGFRGK